MLEADGYIVSTDTNGEWEVVTPGGIIFFSSATRGCVLVYRTLTSASTSRVLCSVCKNITGFNPQESKSPKTGIAIADVKSGRGGKKSGRSGRLTLE